MTKKPTNKLDLKGAREIAEGCIANRMRRADRAVMHTYDAALRPFGLKMTQFTLLVALRLKEPVTIQDLAKAMVMDRTTLTRNLAALTRQDMVRVTPGEDRRTRVVELTSAGHAALARAFPEWRKAQARVRRKLGADRSDRLVRALAEAVDTLA
jgi:DNA-binding MarR family transcriptional regulator